MASRKLSDLTPELKEICEEFKEQCAEAGIDVLVYCTWRGEEEQNKAFAEGKSKLKYPKSKHNCVDSEGNPASRAFDCVPTKGNLLLWSDAQKYAKMGEIGRGLGLRWGGEFRGLVDKPHFEMKD